MMLPAERRQSLPLPRKSITPVSWPTMHATTTPAATITQMIQPSTG
jgi:hypothetical protein